MKCKFVKKIWSELGLEEHQLKWSDSASPKDMIEVLFPLPEEEKLLGIALLRNWWQARNKINAEGKALSLESTIHQIRKSAGDFKEHFIKNANARPEKNQKLETTIGRYDKTEY